MSIDVDLRPHAVPAATADVRAPARAGIASFPGVLPTNPYQRLLYGELERFGFHVVDDSHLSLGWLWRERRRVGFLHFHWPQSYWRHETSMPVLRPLLDAAKIALFGMRLAAARALRYRIAWTIHQVYPHEIASPRGDRLGTQILARQAHILLCHDAATRRHAAAELGKPGRSVTVVPHGSYIGVYPEGRSRDEVRRALGVDSDATLFLLFGDLREYKGLELLLEAFAAVGLEEAALVVAGSDSDGRAGAAVEAAATTDGRIRARIGYVPDDAVAELFAAADTAVIARSDGGTSGSLILALSLGRPVIAAASGVHAELTRGEDTGWTFEPRDAPSLAGALLRAASATAAQREAKGEAALRCAQRLRWPEIGERTARLFVGAREATS